jgi:23S rRNA (adenine2503-C2)-methyltransferase
MDERAERFRELLTNGHVAAFIRQNRGRDIAGACGQLANRGGEKTAESP